MMPKDQAGYTIRDADAAPEDTKPSLRLVTAAELLTMKVPVRQMALAPILPQPGLSMLYAPRGMGKTHVALSLAYAMASGGKALRWQAPQPRRVVHVDGEMPAGALQERLAQIVRGAGYTPPADDFLRFLAADLMPDGLSSIARPEVQAALDAATEDAEVLILDNLSTLAGGLRENEADDWEPVQQWLPSQRRRGKHVLVIHHAGKSAQQRGTSRREDVLDTVIALRRPSDYEPEQGARFEVHLEKARGILGADTAPFEARLVKAEGGGVTWAIADLKDAQRDRAEELLAEGMSVRDIAEETGMSKSAVHRIKMTRDKRDSTPEPADGRG